MLSVPVLRVTEEEHNGIMKSLDFNKEELEQKLQSIREWLKKEPHLPDTEDDKIILSALMLNKFSIERTKQKLDACYAFKHISPEMYMNYEPLNPNVQKTMDMQIMLPLPKLTENYCRVFVMKTNSDAENFNHLDCLQYVLICMEVCMKFDYALNNCFICDLSGFTLGHIKNVSLPLLAKCVTFYSSVFSNNLKGFHYLNVPPFTQSLIQLIKSSLKNKLAERVYIHNDLESLHKHISKNVLPAEYGGTEGPLSEINSEWRQFVESKNDWIKARANMKSNEKLRIGKMEYSDIYGVEGSFRKLNVD